ncbi:MAG: hypothetical protein H6970_14950 [Gammaproteobacteria bacterium]|nr:hypothetical protein [Gammaproteobacteria bacterium]MCP5458271.1 hypothetical protein [Gammaproteobacteria bacterium]
MKAGKNLNTGCWALWRLDDNGNEVEMQRFPDRSQAERVKETFEKRGHKQAYFVRFTPTNAGDSEKQLP